MRRTLLRDPEDADNLRPMGTTMGVLTIAPSRPATITVVGAGPVGLAVALEVARRGARVLLIEAGSVALRAPRGSRPLGGIAQIADASGHAAIDVATRVGLGGTSELWGGRCVQFEPVDFSSRSQVAETGWPIDLEEVRAVADRAAQYLDCGKGGFSATEQSWIAPPSVKMGQLERWSRHPQLRRRLGHAVLSHPRIDVLGDTVVTGLQFAGDAVVALRALQRGRQVVIPVAQTVLACGGVKTTRLLLNVQAEQPHRFGGPDGVLGRFYSGHLTGSLCRVTFNDPREARGFLLTATRDGSVVRRRFTIDTAAQREHGLLNAAFFLVNPSFGDPTHRSGPLSLTALLLSLPALGNAFGKRHRVASDTGSNWLRAHLANVGRQPVRSVASVGLVAYRRYISTNPRWEFVSYNPNGSYALQYHAEQLVRADNRITLNNLVGQDGLRNVDIQFGFANQDIRSVVDSHLLLAKSLNSTGRFRVEFPTGALEDHVRAQASDGYHQIGTLRMSASPEHGVVDPNLRVHGIEGLSVAGSAVFPTAGEANPTFMAVSLGIRLARSLTLSAVERK